MTEKLASRLRVVSDMINMGEKIEWGSETALMDEAAAYIEQLEKAAGDKWLPIESAPRDGTRIIGAYFYADTPYNLYKSYYRDDGWRSVTSSTDYGWEPTHWMPLPTPPEEEAVKPLPCEHSNLNGDFCGANVTLCSDCGKVV